MESSLYQSVAHTLDLIGLGLIALGVIGAIAIVTAVAVNELRKAKAHIL